MITWVLSSSYFFVDLILFVAFAFVKSHLEFKFVNWIYCLILCFSLVFFFLLLNCNWTCRIFTMILDSDRLA